MKKLLLLCGIFLLYKTLVFAQCTPDTRIEGAFIYPEKMSPAMAGYYYYQTLTFRVVKDTDIVYNGNNVHAVVDSAQVVFMSGIPAGYSYTCSPARCTWPGGSLGCALIEGETNKNDTAMVGEYPIKIYVQTWFKVVSLNLNRIDSSDYTFKILSYNGQFEITKAKPLTVYPNPGDGNLTIELRNIQSDNNLIQVFALNGELVYEKRFDKPATYLSLEEVKIANPASGLYQIRLLSGNELFAQKVMVH